MISEHEAMTRNNPTRRSILIAGLATLATPAVSRASPSTQQIGGPIYGTTWRVILHASANTEPLVLRVREALDRIDRLMSPWQPDSEISRFNRNRSDNWFATTDETLTVCRCALEVHHASSGRFDPTVGPIVGAWGFGPIKGPAPVEGETIEIGDGGLRKITPNTTIDLCGIAKGYALDQITGLLLHHGVADFVVDLGGEILGHGMHPEGRRWRVAIEDPRPGHDRAVDAVVLDGRAIATSGNRINSFNLGSRTYSHIIDPITGVPVDSATASVSVIANRGMDADAWATALMAAGSDGPALAERNHVDALFLVLDGPRLRPVATGNYSVHQM